MLQGGMRANGRHVRAGYVHLHGSRAQLALIDRIAELEARHATLLAQLPDQTRQHFRRRHAEASEAPGADSGFLAIFRLQRKRILA